MSPFMPVSSRWRFCHGGFAALIFSMIPAFSFARRAVSSFF
jgi:hypothetical protein